MPFVNLTPHTIHLPTGDVPPSGAVARCSEETEHVTTVDGVPFVYRNYGAVSGVPEPENRVWLIVSHMCRVALPRRLDLVSPGDLTRDESGQITGCTNLVMNRIRL